MAVDGDEVDDDDDRDMLLLSLLLCWTRHCSGVHAICRSSGCTCGLWKACGCNGLWPLVLMADRGASLIPHEDSCLYRQRGIAKLILNGYRDRLFLLFLLLFVPSSDISLGIAMASMDWARRGTALTMMTMAMTMPMVMMTMTMTVTTMTMTATTLLCFVPTAMATKYRRASHRVWHRKGARRGKAAAHNTLHSTAARSTAQIIKAANGVEHCQFIVQPSHRQARTIPWRSARLGG